MRGFLHLLRSFSFGYWRRHPVITLLAILSIALGATVYLAVCVANHSAIRAFRAGIDLVSGKSHLEVRATSGSLREEVYPLAAAVEGVLGATPVLEGYATLPGRPGEYLHLLGLDVFTNLPFQTNEVTRPAEIFRDPESWFAQPGQLLLDERLATDLDLDLGEIFPIEVNAERREVQVAFLRQAEGLDAATSSRVAALDIGWAQELLSRQGELTSIQIVLEDSATLEVTRAALLEALPAGLQVEPPAQRSGQLEKMLGGFQLNLLALSLVSILVGVFLVYNAVAAGVVRRRRETGTLLALGTSRHLVRLIFVAEAVALALIGILIGIPAGLFLSKALLGQVSEIVSMHYLAIQASEIFLHPRHLLETLAYGLFAAVLGAWLPATEAANCEPARVLRPGREAVRSPRESGARILAALGVFGLGGLSAWAALTRGLPLLSFAACFFAVGGFALLVPTLTRFLSRPILALRRPELVQLGLHNLLGSLHRNAMTIAALMASVAMAVGVSTMIHSFRGTIVTWTNQAMTSDLYVAPAANLVIGREAYLPEVVRAHLDADPDVALTESFLEQKSVSETGRPFKLSVVDGVARANLPFLGGEAERKVKVWFEPDRVVVNEAYFRHFGKTDGDQIFLETPAGPKPFVIAGVFRDYADDRGTVLMTRPNFDRHWDEPRMHSLAVDLREGAELEPVRERLRAAFEQRGELLLYSNRDIREKIIEIFDQTFAVTYVLRTIAVFVAVFGVILTLSTLVGERRREIGTLRALGASRGQVQAIHLSEAGLIGWFSALIGIACGLLLAVILTWVVNLAFFGWTVDFAVPWKEIVLVPVWVTLVAALAGIWPSAEAARVAPAESLRTE